MIFSRAKGRVKHSTVCIKNQQILQKPQNWVFALEKGKPVFLYIIKEKRERSDMKGKKCTNPTTSFLKTV